MKYTPDNITELKEDQVFVFGTNANGAHVGGAARLAYNKFGAVYGTPHGLQGKSYGIITLDRNHQKVRLSLIKEQLMLLYSFAEHFYPDKEFLVTKIGCGIAGFDENDIRQVFEVIDYLKPSNVIIPKFKS